MKLRLIQWPASDKTRFNLAGAAILLIGLCCATWIWIAQDRIDRENAGGQDDGTDQLAILDSRKEVRDLELYYGKSGVIVQEWSDWLQSLAHGKRLAATVAVASSILGIGCFLAGAHLFPSAERASPPDDSAP
jgi:hypothetical protein